MTSNELQQALAAMPSDTEAHEAVAQVVAATNAPFWVGIAAKALGVARSFFKLNGTQSAAWDLVTSVLTGGGV